MTVTSTYVFKDFKEDFQRSFSHLIENADTDRLYILDVPKDELWNTYINSFP